MRTLAAGLAVTATVWLLAIGLLFLIGRRSAAREVATFLPNLVILFRGLMRDPRVPASSRLLLGFCLLWFLSPVDLIPEFVPVIGPLDDAVVAAIVLRRLVKTAGRQVMQDHWRGQDQTLDRLLRISGAGRS